MMIMTAKLDFKKTILIIAAVAAVVLSIVLLAGGRGSSEATAVPAASGNDARVKFLSGFGWEVKNSPTQSSQVRIPDETSQVYERYNALQKTQGYDLTGFAGKKVMRYVYEITNFPGATEPVYATILVYKDQIIGGDVTSTGANGKIRPFAMPKAPQVTAPTQAPTESPTETVPET